MTPKLARRISADELHDLKAITRRALELARPTKFAMVTRVDAPALSNYGAVNKPDTFMPIDVAIDLCRDLGSPIVVEEMARLLGYRLVPMDDDGASADINGDDLAEVAKETSDVVVSLAAALPGGIDRHEKRAIQPQIHEAIGALRRLERKVGGGR